MGMGFSKFQELVVDKEAWFVAVHRVAQLSDWTELEFSGRKKVFSTNGTRKMDTYFFQFFLIFGLLV